MRALTILSSICIPGSGQFGAGHPRRGLLWVAACVAAGAASLWLGAIAVLVVWLAQAIDAGFVELEDRGLAWQLGAAVASLATLLVGVVVVRVFVTEAFRIPAGSMIPTLQVGDHVMTAKWPFTPRRGDVVVFRYPKEPDKDFVKRVIAVGGDTVELRDEQIILNGRPVPRTHVDSPCQYDDDADGRWETRQCDAWDETLDGRTYRVVFDRERSPRDWAPVTIPPGHVYVLGDNRDNSHDSRYFGTVPPELLRARARLIYWSQGPDGVRWSRLNRRVR